MELRPLVCITSTSSSVFETGSLWAWSSPIWSDWLVSKPWVPTNSVSSWMELHVHATMPDLEPGTETQILMIVWQWCCWLRDLPNPEDAFSSSSSPAVCAGKSSSLSAVSHAWTCGLLWQAHLWTCSFSPSPWTAHEAWSAECLLTKWINFEFF